MLLLINMQILRYNLLGLLVAISFNVTSQSLYNDGALLSISSDAVLSVNESFLNKGQVLNSGKIEIRQHWMNLGNYQSTGEVALTGSELQHVSLNEYVVGKLTIDGGDKAIQGDLVITESLNLVHGKLNAGSDFKVILETNATIIGGSEEAYIIGELELTSGTDRYYPIGNEQWFLPVWYTETSDARSISFKVNQGKISQVPNDTIKWIHDAYFWEMESSESVSGYLKLEYKELAPVDQTIDDLVLLQAEEHNGVLTILNTEQGSETLSEGILLSENKSQGSVFGIGKRQTIQSSGELNVRNLVTPNGDNQNDFLFIENIEEIANPSVLIIDRTGKTVFESDAYNNTTNRFEGFDSKGRVLGTGTYYYIVKEGDRTKASGFLELIR